MSKQDHNPFRHREIFDSFIEELEKNREYFAKMCLEADNKKLNNDIDDKVKFIDDFAELKVMSDMLYIHQWIIKHYAHSLLFIEAFREIASNLKFKSNVKFDYPKGYDEIMDQVKKSHDHNKSLNFNRSCWAPSTQELSM